MVSFPNFFAYLSNALMARSFLSANRSAIATILTEPFAACSIFSTAPMPRPLQPTSPTLSWLFLPTSAAENFGKAAAAPATAIDFIAFLLSIMISYFPLYVLNLRVESAVSFKNFGVLFWGFYGLPVFKPDKAAVALVPDFFEYFGVVDFS